MQPTESTAQLGQPHERLTPVIGAQELFPLQHEGVDFLRARRFAILGDAPRVGKTPQTVVALDHVAPKHVEIVCPANALGIWPQAIEDWSAGLWSYGLRSYEIAARDGLPEAEHYVFDEGHYLMNPEANRTRALLGKDSPVKRASRIWTLSGTICPNGYPTEVWTWLRLFGRTKLTWQRFLERFTQYTTTEHGVRIFGSKNEEEFRELLAPVFLRRELLSNHGKRWGTLPLVAPDFDIPGSDALADYIRVHDDLPEEDDQLAHLRLLIGQVKAAPLAEFLYEELKADTHKVAIYAWHTCVLDILEAKLAPFGVARVDGSVPSGPKRQAQQNRFNDPAGPRVWLAQIRAACEAIDIASCCNNFVAAEMSWSSGQNDQMFRRLDGPKQTKEVLIRVAHLRGSIDDPVSRVNLRKARMTGELYSTSALAA